MDLSKILNEKAHTTIPESESESSLGVIPPSFVLPDPSPPSKHSFAVILHDWQKAGISSPYHRIESSMGVRVNVATTSSSIAMITPGPELPVSLGASTSTSSDRHKSSNKGKSRERSPRKEEPTGTRTPSRMELGLGLDVTETSESLQRPVEVPELQQEAPQVVVATPDQAEDSVVPPPNITHADKRRQKRPKPYEVEAPRRSARLREKRERNR